MASTQRQVVKTRVQLVVYDTTDMWLDLMPFFSTVGVSRVRGRIVLCDKTGNFRVRIGIQTYSGDPEAPDAPTPISSGSGYSYVSTVGKNFVDFDPTAAGNGDIDGKEGFRLGLLYSSSTQSVARGDVIIEYSIDA